jgi:hypothetical protein
MINFTDAVLMDGEPRITSDGYMVASAKAARTGVQVYNRSELGLDGEGTINVYRPEEEVFARDSLATYPARPITINHPPKGVNADNWKDVGSGAIGGEVVRDGEFVRVPLIMMDGPSIQKAQTTHREISMGYSAEIVMQDGVAPDGQPYQARQRNIKINHLAFVPKARGGNELRIGDGADTWGASPISDAIQPKKGARSMTTLTLKGISVELADAKDAINLQSVFDGLNKDVADAISAKAKADADHATAIAAKDADLAKKDAELDALKGKVVDDAALDARVQARADLIAVATSIAPDVKTAGLADADIRKAVVTAKLGDADLKDKSAAYIDAYFDILTKDAKAQGDLRQAIAGINPNLSDAQAVDAAHTKSVTDLNAWRNQSAAQ